MGNAFSLDFLIFTLPSIGVSLIQLVLEIYIGRLSIERLERRRHIIPEDMAIEDTGIRLYQYLLRAMWICIIVTIVVLIINVGAIVVPLVVGYFHGFEAPRLIDVLILSGNFIYLIIIGIICSIFLYVAGNNNMVGVIGAPNQPAINMANLGGGEPNPR